MFHCDWTVLWFVVTAVYEQFVFMPDGTRIVLPPPTWRESKLLWLRVRNLDFVLWAVLSTLMMLGCWVFLRGPVELLLVVCPLETLLLLAWHRVEQGIPRALVEQYLYQHEPLHSFRQEPKTAVGPGYEELMNFTSTLTDDNRFNYVTVVTRTLARLLQAVLSLPRRLCVGVTRGARWCGRLVLFVPTTLSRLFVAWMQQRAVGKETLSSRALAGQQSVSVVRAVHAGLRIIAWILLYAGSTLSWVVTRAAWTVVKRRHIFNHVLPVAGGALCVWALLSLPPVIKRDDNYRLPVSPGANWSTSQHCLHVNRMCDEPGEGVGLPPDLPTARIGTHVPTDNAGGGGLPPSWYVFAFLVMVEVHTANC
ncbi:MAG: hypothetical protein CME32_09260 [Gimesia sp.]|nr:hypothetical protein [Gimesia sp.]